MSNIYYDIAKINKFTPYITAGAGVAINRTNNYTQYLNSTENDPASLLSYSKGKKTHFTWKIGLGGKYQINQSFDLDLRYQYIDLGRFATGKTASLNGGAYQDTNSLKGKLNAHEALLGVTYNF